MRQLLAFAMGLCAMVASAAEPTVQELATMKRKLMEETKVNALMGIDGPVAKFKSDGDPKTLEIVILDKPDPDANTVSEDGEVIFLFEASGEVQSKLIGKAFDLRARRRLGVSQ